MIVKAKLEIHALSCQSEYSVAQTSVPYYYCSAVDMFSYDVVKGNVTLENLQE